MQSFQPAGLEIVIITGEMKGKRAEFGNSFDPTYSITEGQYRALYMKLNRLIVLPHFSFNSQYELDGNQSVYFASTQNVGRTIVYAVISRSGKFSEILKAHIQKITNRGGIYTAKRFYEELSDLRGSELESSTIDELSYPQAIELLESMPVTSEKLPKINQIMQIVANHKISPVDDLNQLLVDQLSMLPDDLEIDIILDSSYSVANQYKNLNIVDKAKDIYLAIAAKAEMNERLALMISCRLNAALIMRESGADATEILSVLDTIDDGSLEVASQDEREQYYTMQGYCYEKLDQVDLAEDLHFMSVMIAEAETSPSIFVAESHAFLGKRARETYQPEIAAREYLTASTIATSRNDPHLANIYSHQAAVSELDWAHHLSSTGIVMNMNNDKANAEFYSWQAMKRIVNSISHSDRSKRKNEILPKTKIILDTIRSILSNSSEYAINTINELDNQLNFIGDGVLPLDQEKELLKFISTKITAMLPLPPPVILLIANDGRLIMGGEIGSDNWDESTLSNDDLFSGALSAIMAILSEVISGDNPLRMLDAGQTQIMIEKSSVCIGALLVDRDLNIIRKALQDCVMWMETTFPDLSDWDGYSIDFTPVKPKIEDIFSEALENIAN